MSDPLRLLLMIFTAPLAGLRLVRDRALLLPAFGLAWAASLLYCFYTQWQHWIAAQGRPGAWALVRFVFGFTFPLLMLAFVLAPTTLFLASKLFQLGRFRELLRQHYPTLLACLFYVWAMACIWAMPLAVLTQATGWRNAVMTETKQMLAQRPGAVPPETQPEQINALLSVEISFFLLLPFFALWFFLAVREVLRPAVGPLLALASGSLALGGLLSLLTSPLFLLVASSPLLMALLFIVLRRYSSVFLTGTQAGAELNRQPELAALNPADASAHYNLGLMHLGRNQLDEAQKCFTRTLEIDAEEVGAHYELGRIARAQSRWADAIGHFGEVVARDEAHAQHEVWREIGATYLSAQQYADARAMLERFLQHREFDPQALYLLGRAFAGLGEKEAARAALASCIEAVETSPNYKHQAEKRWRTEAQQFLRSLA